MVYQSFYASPLGSLLIGSDGAAVTRVVFVDDSRNNPEKLAKGKLCDVLQCATMQLDEYFLGRRRSFTIPFSQQGTPFELLVWSALQDVPYGKTVSYVNVARMIGKPTAVRAVASAIAKNSILLFIPCHRVVRSDGTIGKYSCGTWRKLWLIVKKNIAYAHIVDEI